MAPKEGTQPVPFRLKTDDRHKLHEAQQRVRLAEERRRVRTRLSLCPC